jgi:predicted nucleotidyltransferase
LGKLLQPLDRLLGSQSKVALLRVLLRVGGSVSAREAARLAGIAHSGARRALEDLTRMGVLDRVETPAQHLYAVNSSSELLQTGLAPLFEAERQRVDEVFRWIRGALGAYLADGRVVSVVIYGSAARGDDEPDSDLDLLVVTGEEDDVHSVHRCLTDAAPDLFRRYGLDLSPVVLSAGQLARQSTAGDTFGRQAAREGRLVAGSPLETLLKPADSARGA